MRGRVGGVGPEIADGVRLMSPGDGCARGIRGRGRDTPRTTRRMPVASLGEKESAPPPRRCSSWDKASKMPSSCRGRHLRARHRAHAPPGDRGILDVGLDHRCRERAGAEASSPAAGCGRSHRPRAWLTLNPDGAVPAVSPWRDRRRSRGRLPFGWTMEMQTEASSEVF